MLFADRVAETSTTYGLVAYVLNGAVTGSQTFTAGIGNAKTCYYAVTDNVNWEVGIGTVTAGSPDSLSRDTIIASSNAGAAVNWNTAVKTIWVDLPADRITQFLEKDIDSQIDARINIGNPGIEAAGIDINGTVYDSALRVTDIGANNTAQVVLNRHSTTLYPVLLCARSNSDNVTTHGVVASGMQLASWLAAGFTGDNYDLFGSIDFFADTGAISTTSSPGKIVLSTTAAGSNTPTPAITIDSSQNVGIGVVPEASHSSRSVLQIGLNGTLQASTALNQLYLGNNFYTNTSGFDIYISTNEASREYQNQGSMYFQVAPSGTAGSAITWTDALTLDNSGNAAFGGNVSLGDNNFLNIGTGNDIQLTYASGTTLGSLTVNQSAAGHFNFTQAVNTGLWRFYNDDSAGASKQTLNLGGATPKVDIYGDGVIHFSTKASSTYRTINFPAIPTSATGLAAGDVWSNSGVLTIV